jgi:subtilisin family serine protease
MKLKCGHDDWLDLEHMQIERRPKRQIEEGRSYFEPRTAKAGRAAVLANRVVARTFRKSYDSEADRAASSDIDASKVEVAVYRDDTGKHRVIYREAVLRFEAGSSQASRRKLLAKFRLRIRKANAFRANQFIVYDPSRRYMAETMLELTNALNETEEVAFAFPNFVSEFKRSAVPGPRPDQWHLATVSARKAWKRTRGKGITIAILDDGVDVEHPGLKHNVVRNPDPKEPRDVCGRDFFIDEENDDAGERFDPRPKIFRFPFTDSDTNDNHGTPCAGVAAASGKAGRVFGIAPRARVLPVKIFHGDALVPESSFANAIRYASRFADVLSCSWDGPRGPDLHSALEEAGDGRDGRGCPIFAASGNENTRIGYPASSPHAIAVGASTVAEKTGKERRSHYSNYGRSLSILAPSSGGSADREIFSTDVSSPRRGYNPGFHDAGGRDGMFCNDFGGTSSSTPLAAGVAALMLSANPDLSREEVREILQATAVKIGPKKGYSVRGHGPKYGFGRIDAAAAVAAAFERRHA